jgi:hypothetical protein
MKYRKEEQTHQVYIPALAISCATFRSSWNRLQVARADEPNVICGIAQRIGYTGTSDHDLAIYRLKVKGEVKGEEGRNIRRTMAAPFVLEDGVFKEYEKWCLKHNYMEVEEEEAPTSIYL